MLSKGVKVAKEEPLGRAIAMNHDKGGRALFAIKHNSVDKPCLFAG